MTRLLLWDGRCAGPTSRAGGHRERVSPTRPHAGRSLSARHRAGLLRPSRPCSPRDHPPNGSIGPYLVIRPEADLALVACTLEPAQLGSAHRSFPVTAVLLRIRLQATHVPVFGRAKSA